MLHSLWNVSFTQIWRLQVILDLGLEDNLKLGGDAVTYIIRYWFDFTIRLSILLGNDILAQLTLRSCKFIGISILYTYFVISSNGDGQPNH